MGSWGETVAGNNRIWLARVWGVIRACDGEFERVRAGSRLMRLFFVCGVLLSCASACGQQDETVPYQNRLQKLSKPEPILADYPQYFEPIVEENRFEAPAIVNDENADLEVRAWRFSTP